MTDDKLKLTRRRVLAGLGGIGVASGAAGLGTSAYFNDTESFTDNSIGAGELNLAVSTDVRNKSAELPDPVVESDSGTDDTADGNEVTITVADMKPGDWFLLEWDCEVYSNPGYVQITSVDEDFSNDEGENPEAETDTNPPGDLGDAMLTTVWNDFVSSGGTGDLRPDLEGLDPTTDHNNSTLGNYETPDLDGITGGGAHYTTLNEAHDVYKTGVTMRHPGTGDPLEVEHGSGAATFYQLFELPYGVGNGVQGDSVTFTHRFNAEQVRHNDDPFNSS